MTEIIIAILLHILTITGDKTAEKEQADTSKEKTKKEQPIKSSGGSGDWKDDG